MPHDFRVGIYVVLMDFFTLQVCLQMAFDVENPSSAPRNATSHLHVVTASTFFSGFCDFSIFWGFFLFFEFFSSFFFVFSGSGSASDADELSSSSLRFRWWGGTSSNT